MSLKLFFGFKCIIYSIIKYQKFKKQINKNQKSQIKNEKSEIENLNHSCRSNKGIIYTLRNQEFMIFEVATTRLISRFWKIRWHKNW